MPDVVKPAAIHAIAYGRHAGSLHKLYQSKRVRQLSSLLFSTWRGLCNEELLSHYMLTPAANTSI
jgi:hypothetical protein